MLESIDMHMKPTLVVAAALCLAIAPAATAQTPVTKTKSVTATATIQAIDSTTRSITFKDETGRNAHLSGDIAKALFAKADELLSGPPQIEKLEILASKAPGA